MYHLNHCSTLPGGSDGVFAMRLKFYRLGPIKAVPAAGLRTYYWVMMIKPRLTIILLSAAMSVFGAVDVQATSLIQTSFTAISRSLATSSNSSATSSTNTANDIGQIDGDFKITKIAAAEGTHDRMQIALEAAGNDRTKDIYLNISAQDYENVNLGVGQTVSAVQHAYGVAFVREGEKEPFAIVVADAWIKDLGVTRVAL